MNELFRRMLFLPEQASTFSAEVDRLHYIIITLRETDDLNKAKNLVADYNKQYYNLDNLRVSNIYLGDMDNKTPMIVIRRFKDRAASMKFYDNVLKNRNAFMTGDFDYQVYSISQNNYRQILKDRTVSGYIPFFESNYLK